MSATTAPERPRRRSGRLRNGTLLLVVALALGLAAHLWWACCTDDIPAMSHAALTPAATTGHHAAHDPVTHRTTTSAPGSGGDEVGVGVTPQHDHDGIALLCGALLTMAALGFVALLVRRRPGQWWFRLPRVLSRRPPPISALLPRPSDPPLVMRC